MEAQRAARAAAKEYMVKGSTIRSKFDFVRKREGAAAEQRFRARFGTATTILDSAWYPFQIFDDVNRGLVEEFLEGDESRLEEVGRYSAGRAFSGIYKSFLASPSFDRFLERIASLHDLMYSEGKMTVEPDVEHRSCRIFQTGAPYYTTRDLYVAQGFYAHAAELFHLEGVRCRFREIPDGVVFDLSWR